MIIANSYPNYARSWNLVIRGAIPMLMPIYVADSPFAIGGHVITFCNRNNNPFWKNMLLARTKRA